MIYNIDFHVHTDHSMDGVSSLEELIAAARRRNLNGIAITDHNISYIGETIYDGDFFIIPGCEVSTLGGHIVALFIEEEINPGKIWGEKLPTIKEAVNVIHKCGGIAILAHPFNKADKIYTDEELSLVDGIEVYNARACFKNKKANIMASKLAQQHSYCKVAGSDGHSKAEVGNAYVAVDADQFQLEALKKAITDGKTQSKLIRNTPHYRKGISQFYKAFRSQNILKIGKAIIYMGYCITLDCIKK